VIRRRIFAVRKDERPTLSPRGLWVRIAHWARIGVEVAIVIAAATALTWSPSPSLAPSAAAALTPPSMPHLEAAARATAAENAALVALLAPALGAREHVGAAVRSGDTLQDVMRRADVSGDDFNAAILALRDVFDPRTLRAGQHIDLFLEHGGAAETALVGLAFAPDVERRIEVTRQADGRYHARHFEVPLTRRVARAQGTITESLYVNAKAEGASDLVIAEIASLLAYTVDFQREIHPGDAFDIVFEQFLDPAGEIVKTGDIYYVGFTPSGRNLAYWRYTPPGADEETGFYDVAGESARRFLMKTPVNATRISSGFSSARRHPILGYTRAHKGTDFAAPRGTPIYAAGNGVVERANVYGSYGNYVRIRHANGYKTIYGHLNGFARGVRAGTRVSQGQVIGYVGMTGGATGPHLHYEVHLNGTAVNPMTIEAPTGRTLNEDEIPAFEVERLMIDALKARALPADAPADGVLVAGEPADHAALEAIHLIDGCAFPTRLPFTPHLPYIASR
jgi:murein DD-endopeptidase MepM/ murein hydrolase activator NlpD